MPVLGWSRISEGIGPNLQSAVPPAIAIASTGEFGDSVQLYDRPAPPAPAPCSTPSRLVPTA
ncbi:hypothetical protein ABZY09_40475 [Streptomyces sp. NPDC002928]|uniref:hypothetical protein n=1 Tax=Streptomyces sp. NPDC002928 TaxID=3154440 RepID=UPI0033A6551D